MNIVDKVIKLWWVILSFIIFINGFGFIYTGLKHDNRNWVIEGIIYEIPWFFFIIYVMIFGSNIFGVDPGDYVLLFALVLLIVSIIRSIWLAIKLWDVYDNNDKYAQNPTELANPNKVKENNKLSSTPVCCLCIAIIFFIFALMAVII